MTQMWKSHTIQSPLFNRLWSLSPNSVKDSYKDYTLAVVNDSKHQQVAYEQYTCTNGIETYTFQMYG